MKIKILGAHSFESKNTKLSAILIDNTLALDAGGLTSSLSFAEQGKIEYILLTHGHYDHIRDVPAIALKSSHRTINIYATKSTLDVLSTHLINGVLYPKFTEWPSPESPVLRLHTLEPYQTENIGAYSALAVPVSHAVPAVGYQITNAEGKSMFYSGDTGPGLSACWEKLNPDLLIVETHFSNKSADIAPKPGHLCPSLLGKELASFRQLKGNIPKVVLTHMNPDVENEIRNEAAQLANELGVDIRLAYEGMEIEL